MIDVSVVGLAVDSRSQPLILLRPRTEPAGRVLPIWIGAQEATSILIAIEGGEAPRPLSHDLMKSLLETLGAVVEQVAVTRIEDGTFYAEIVLQTPVGRRVLDARPSDAIALASRVDAPIRVAEEVLEEAGIVDDALGGDDAAGSPEERAAEEESKVAEFRRFLEDIDPEDFQG